MRSFRLSALGRTVTLLGGELACNTIIWAISGFLFRKPESRGVLSLCLLAWTLGLRHGLDADHISAIDNATRSLMALGQMPVTCGLFFSLGHSTIVIVVNVAIAISSDVYHKIGDVGSVGGIIGPAISASFLFLIGTANSVILWRIIMERREDSRKEQLGLPPSQNRNSTPSIVLRLLGPVTKFVDRPWKMYPVGVLFGLGFDTASSIALLAVTALARKSSNVEGTIPRSRIIVLPLLFTVGMTLVDSIDSCIMLHSYAGIPDEGWSLFEKKSPPNLELSVSADLSIAGPEDSDGKPLHTVHQISDLPPQSNNMATSLPLLNLERPTSSDQQISESRVSTNSGALQECIRKKQHTMSSLSIILTLISILVAFSISLITIMGLVGGHCTTCKEAAENDKGLAGRWWRFWAKVNDSSGLIGAAIVGVFIAIVVCFYLVRWLYRRYIAKRAAGWPHTSRE